MVKKITWKCTHCGNEDVYPGDDNVTVESLKNSNSNTMCKLCGAPCMPLSVESLDENE